MVTTITVISAKGASTNAVNKLGELEGKVKNPQAKAALEVATQVAEQSEATVESSLTEMSGRPGFLRFIIGPDYKNAGMVRSEIVRMRNEIAKLTRTREKVSAADQAAIDESISALETDLTAIENRLSQALTGVSLFGWLSKLLTGFATPTPTATPTPVVSPTASPV